jgi:hypothetical protein
MARAAGKRGNRGDGNGEAEEKITPDPSRLHNLTKVRATRQDRRTAVGEDQAVKEVSANLRQAARIFDEEGFEATDYLVSDDHLPEELQEMRRDGLRARKQWKLTGFTGEGDRVPVIGFLPIPDCHATIDGCMLVLINSDKANQRRLIAQSVFTPDGVMVNHNYSNEGIGALIKMVEARRAGSNGGLAIVTPAARQLSRIMQAIAGRDLSQNAAEIATAKLLMENYRIRIRRRDISEGFRSAPRHMAEWIAGMVEMHGHFVVCVVTDSTSDARMKRQYLAMELQLVFRDGFFTRVFAGLKKVTESSLTAERIYSMTLEMLTVVKSKRHGDNSVSSIEVGCVASDADKAERKAGRYLVADALNGPASIGFVRGAPFPQAGVQMRLEGLDADRGSDAGAAVSSPPTITLVPGGEEGRSLTRILRARAAVEPHQVAFQQDDLVRSVVLLKSQVLTATDANHNIASALREMLEMTFRMTSEEVASSLEVPSREEDHSHGVFRGTAAEADECIRRILQCRGQHADFLVVGGAPRREDLPDDDCLLLRDRDSKGRPLMPTASCPDQTDVTSRPARPGKRSNRAEKAPERRRESTLEAHGQHFCTDVWATGVTERWIDELPCWKAKRKRAREDNATRNGWFGVANRFEDLTMMQDDIVFMLFDESLDSDPLAVRLRKQIFQRLARHGVRTLEDVLADFHQYGALLHFMRAVHVPGLKVTQLDPHPFQLGVTVIMCRKVAFHALSWGRTAPFSCLRLISAGAVRRYAEYVHSWENENSEAARLGIAIVSIIPGFR